MSEWKRCPIQNYQPARCNCQITSTAICGSDLHIYDGIPTMKSGDILGHEFMGRSLSWAASRMCKRDRLFLSPNCFSVTETYGRYAITPTAGWKLGAIIPSRLFGYPTCSVATPEVRQSMVGAFAEMFKIDQWYRFFSPISSHWLHGRKLQD